MSTNIFLGYPPENIKRFIIENYGPKDMTKVPLHFTANEDGSSVSFVCYNDMEGEFIDSQCEFQYSTDTMKSWNDYPKNGNSEEAKIKLDKCENKTVYFRAKQGNVEGNPNLNGFLREYGMILHYFVIEGSIKADGNIQFLLENTGTKMDVPAYCYARMFNGCVSLTQAPELPATTLAECCYSNMFYGCTSLTQVPSILPAMTLASDCYSYMFSNCKSLTKTPALPATTLAERCYDCMFENCISLTQTPELPATTLANSCYNGMFDKCTSLTQAPELPATTLAEGCYYYMFDGCTNIPEPKYDMSHMAFDEVANKIKNNQIFGIEYYGDPIQVQCSDKILVATFDTNEYIWTISEK